jgi:cardiolipin synthase
MYGSQEVAFDEIRSTWIAAGAARRSIDFETYIFWDGEIAKQMTEALAERAQAGVAVNVILDAQGTGTMGSENWRG